MPNVLGLTQDTKKFDLETVPGGFVELRRLSFKEFIKRREMTTQLKVEMGGGNRQQRRNNPDEASGMKGELAMLSADVVYYEFANCIINHNLEADDDGTLLDFKHRLHVDMLPSHVGDEIGKYINEMNQYDPENLGSKLNGESPVPIGKAKT